MNPTARLIALVGALLTLLLAACNTPSPSQPNAVTDISAVTEALSVGTMHISSMNVGWHRERCGPRGKRGGAYVQILDESGAPVEGATVSGIWSVCNSGAGSGVTVNGGTYPSGSPMPDGTAYIEASRCVLCPKNNCRFTFDVTDVTHPAYTYDPSQDVTTSGYGCCDVWSAPC